MTPRPRYPCPACKGPSIVEVTAVYSTLRGAPETYRRRRHRCRNGACRERFTTREPLAEAQA